MKKILLITGILITNLIYAQFPGGGSAYQDLRLKSDGVNKEWKSKFAASPLTYTASTNTFGADTSILGTKHDLDTLYNSLNSRLSPAPIYFAAAATTSSLTVTYSSNTITATTSVVLPAQDGYTLTVNSKLLVKNQPAGTQLQNGLYYVLSLGSAGVSPYILVRDSLYNETNEISPSIVYIQNGTVSANLYYQQKTVNPVVGTDPITYSTTPAPILPYSVGQNLISISANAWRSSTDMWVTEGGNPYTSSVVDAPAGSIVPTGKVHQFVGSYNFLRIDQLISVDPNITYYGKIFAARISGSGTFYAGYIAYDKNLVQLTGNDGIYGYFIANNASPSSTGTWYYGKVSGQGVGNTSFPVGTRYIKPFIIANYTSSSTMQVGGFEISSVPITNNIKGYDIAIKGVTAVTVDSLGSVGVNTNPDASSLMDLTSTTKGLLIPRMTTTEMNAIVSPANGLQVYSTTASALYYYNGVAWRTVGGSVGNVLYVATTGSDAITTRAGHLGDIAKPFLTLEVARDAAVSGDLIIVLPGTYTVTTTATNGLAKDGVNYYFYPNCTVNKATSGDIFNVDGFTTGFNVYGSANFNKTTASGRIWNCSTNILFNMVFEANDCISTIAVAINYYGQVSNSTYFKTNNIISSGGAAFYTSLNGNCRIDANLIRSTSTTALDMSPPGIGGGKVIVNATKIESTVSYGAYLYNAIVTLNVAYITGPTAGVYVSASNVILNSSVNILTIVGASEVAFNGFATTLNMVLGELKGGSVNALNVTGGYIETTMAASTNTTAITISSGVANVKLETQNFPWALNSTGGKLYISGASVHNTYNGTRTIAGGTVIVSGSYEMLNAPYTTGNAMWTLNSGTLILNSGTFKNAGSVLDAVIVVYNGGTLILNGAALVTASAEIPVIASNAASQSLKVYTGGLTTNRPENGGTLAAKKMKNKITVTAAANTTIVLNDGSGGNETFTALVSGFATKALLAQQIALLINASGTLDITATQDTPGTDEYFYIEADVAGVPFTQTLTNLGTLIQRLNSYLMTNSVGGTIIDDADVQ